MNSSKQTVALDLMEPWRLDLRALGLFRICLGLLLLCDLFIRSTDLSAFYTDGGIVPNQILLDPLARPNKILLSFLSGTTAGVTALFLLNGISILSLIIGYRTKISCLLCWLFHLCILARNPFINHGGDALTQLLLLWSLFIPLGCRFSVDTYTLKDRACAPVCHPYVSNIGTAALLIQVFSIYFLTGWIKFRYQYWLDGNGIVNALQSDLFVKSAGKWLLNYVPFLKLLGRAVLGFEIVAPCFLILSYDKAWLRFSMILSFVALQLGFSIFLHLGIFPWINIISLIPFIPTSVLNWIRIFGSKMEAFARPVLVPANLPFKRLPNILPASRSMWRETITQGFAGILLILYILFSSSTVFPSIKLPHLILDFMHFFSLDSEWKMYAVPARFQWRLLSEGQLANGEFIDLVTRIPGKADIEKLPLESTRVPNTRWRTFFLTFLDDRSEALQRTYASYLCNQWNKVEEQSTRLDRVSIYVIHRTLSVESLPDSPWEKTLKTEYRCE